MRALRTLRTFLKEEYIPFTRPGLGLGSLPGGDRFYAQLLKFYTSTNMTASEVHQLGIEEVERINQEMRSVLGEMGLNNLTIKQFGEFIRCFLAEELRQNDWSVHFRQDPKNFYSSGEELIQDARMTLRDKIQPKLSSFFNKIPSTRLLIKGSVFSMLGIRYKSICWLVSNF